MRRAARVEADRTQIGFPGARVEVLARAGRRFGRLGGCDRRGLAQHLAEGGLDLAAATEDQGRQSDE